MTYFEGRGVENDLTACFVVEGIDRYTLPSRPSSTLDLTPLIYRGSGITYRNENENIEQMIMNSELTW